MGNLLENKIALVTGAGTGIGRKIAITLASEGAYVIVNYIEPVKESAEEVVNTIREAGGQAEAYACWVNDFAAVEEMIKTLVKKLGRIDILVNNAGITRDDLLMRMSEQAFDAVIDTNLKGSFNTMRHIARPMLKQKGGSIINISSVSGMIGNPGQMNYCASKAGVIGMTKSMARELASRNIRVNAVAPGFIDTDMTKAMTDSAKEAGVAQVPLGRMGQPQDIANAVAFLASDKASYITGHVLCVDGGMAM
ncbi:MAG: 3-oxoacyl-[acyl-carrier-protein] reductase [Lachnospiraceae bacterium]|nr:3-oxoacyl-[acyl-carrier-protein] reductase [Lachnospiraceae bacterium]